MTIYRKKEKKCEQCGVLFIPRRRHTKTCSNRCRLQKFRGQPTSTPQQRGQITNVGIPAVRNPKKGVLKDKRGKNVQVKLKIKSAKPEWASRAYLGRKKAPKSSLGERK